LGNNAEIDGGNSTKDNVVKIPVSEFSVRKYWVITKAEILSILVYRFNVLTAMLSSILFVIVAWFLWRAIFAHSVSLSGMTFSETFVYAAIAWSVTEMIFTSTTEWAISYSILEGEIAIHLLRPFDLQLMWMAKALSQTLVNAVLMVLPSFVLVFFIFKAPIPSGENLAFFLLSLVGGFVLGFGIDYLVGLVAFYTESVWGFTAAKNVLVRFLGGALIPLPFFPEGIRHILYWLPFQAIINTPITILTAPHLTILEACRMLSIQLIWVIIFITVTRLIFNRVLRRLTINGG
jgi:ABC-2 type transport system permease protein